MDLRTLAFISILCAALFTLATSTRAQHVNDLTGRSVTAADLVSVLAPKVRDIGLVSPDCTGLRKAAGRGLELMPKADIAAITVEFASGSAELAPGDEKILASLGDALSSETLKPCCFEIEGHTDSIGGAPYNVRLSEHRAQAVVNYLAASGTVERDRMIAVGKGKSQPIASNATPEGRAKNRRVQIVNLGYGEAK
jgi:outer membrane protein OmpA-like peptidoglycan-associated protein